MPMRTIHNRTDGAPLYYVGVKCSRTTKLTCEDTPGVPSAFTWFQETLKNKDQCNVFVIAFSYSTEHSNTNVHKIILHESMNNNSLMRVPSCFCHTSFIQHPFLTLGKDRFEKKQNENAASTPTIRLIAGN